MNQKKTLLGVVTGVGGLLVSVGLMYLMDPKRGARRRKNIRRKVTGAVDGVEGAVVKSGTLLKSRAQDLIGSVGSVYRSR